MRNQHSRRFAIRALSFFLVSLLALGSWEEVAAAQERSGQAPSAAQPALHIVIVEGDGAVNNIKQRTAREMIVQVQDENNRPVAGAAVVFALPRTGAGGAFANGSRTLTVTTDANGRAVAQNFRPNNTAGAFKIEVSASFQGQTAAATISATNASGAAATAGTAATAGAAGGGGGISAATIGIIAGAVGAATAAGVIISRRSSSGSSSPQATIGTGSVPVFGPPRPN